MAEDIYWKKVTKADSNYLGEWDLPLDGSDATFTIADAAEEDVFIPAKNIAKRALVITFVETPKKFVCNPTNADRIEKATGEKLLSQWVGKKIQLYADSTVSFAGKKVTAIRVRVKSGKSDGSKYHCSVCGKEIDENVFKQSVAKYGKAYCSKECLEKSTKGENLL